MKSPLLVAALMLVTVSRAAGLEPSVPDGWTAFPGGGPDSLQGKCVIGVDEALRFAGTDNVSIECANEEPSYGGIFQTFDAIEFRGKRIRYSARMRTENVVGNGRVEGVADIPRQAARIHIGFVTQTAPRNLELE